MKHVNKTGCGVRPRSRRLGLPLCAVMALAIGAVTAAVSAPRGGVYDVKEYGAKGNGVTNDAGAIQKAIDAAAAAGAGVVKLSGGTFMSGTIWLKSNVELRIEEDAVLLGSPDLDDYNEDDAFEQNYKSVHEGWSAKHLVIALEATNVAITGKGVIDGNSTAFFDENAEHRRHSGKLGWRFGGFTPGKKGEMLRPGSEVLFMQCRNVRVEDVTLRNMCCWSCVFHGSEHVRVGRVKVRNDFRHLCVDAFHVDCCRDVKIGDCDIVTADDCFAIRGNPVRLKGPPMVCSDVEISNCVCRSQACGVRIGVGSGEIDGVRISNFKIFDCGYAVLVQSSYGAKSKGVTIGNVEVSDFDVDMSGQAVMVTGGRRSSRAAIRNISFRDIKARTLTAPTVTGMGTTIPDGISFRDCEFTVVGKDGRNSVKITNAGKVELDNVKIGNLFEHGPCYAKWDDTVLTVGNGLFTRSYAVSEGLLRTVSFRTEGGAEWIRDAVKGEKNWMQVSCSSEKRNPAGALGLAARVTVAGKTTVIRVYPEASGVLTEQDWTMPLPEIEVDTTKDAYHQRSIRTWKMSSAAQKVGDTMKFAPFYLRLTETTLFDQTDVRNDLVKSNTRIMPSCQFCEALSVTSLDVRDIATGSGIVFLRLAPMPESRPGTIPDFIVYSPHRFVIPLANGYPVAELVYEGGEAGRIRALQDFQRSIRMYRPGRDGVFLSNTWGDGNSDSRINSEFLMKEVEAAADIGVDVIQIDDGWQRGRTANSRKKPLPGIRKAWSDFRAADPKFWEPDEERFPDGLEPLAKAAKEKGLGFGLWFGPDSSGELQHWEEDADCLLNYYRKLGVRYFKIDSLVITTDLGFERNRKFFDKMLTESDGDMVFDLDCTAAIRPGYFGLMDIGPLFLENRYARGGRRYRPHFALRNLWALSHVVDPVRLRMELLNPGKLRENYAGDPLAPAEWPADALFAITMMASPLGWMELSDVSPEVRAAWRPIVSRWKEERSAMHSGTIIPVGEEPDGWAWTGFFSCAKDSSCAYALLFRELNGEDGFDLDLAPLVPDETAFTKAEAIGGAAEAELDDNGLGLKVKIPAKLGFAWVKLTK